MIFMSADLGEADNRTSEHFATASRSEISGSAQLFMETEVIVPVIDCSSILTED